MCDSTFCLLAILSDHYSGLHHVAQIWIFGFQRLTGWQRAANPNSVPKPKVCDLSVLFELGSMGIVLSLIRRCTAGRKCSQTGKWSHFWSTSNVYESGPTVPAVFVTRHQSCKNCGALNLEMKQRQDDGPKRVESKKWRKELKGVKVKLLLTNWMTLEMKLIWKWRYLSVMIISLHCGNPLHILQVPE